MSLPYFPMFPTDFDADTGHLTFAEDGAYNRLLRLSWKCPGAKMPEDMDWIHRRARAVSIEEKALVASVISEFFTRSGGKIFSPRLAKEWQKSSLAHSKRVSAGSSGGKAKALNAKANDPSNAKAMLYQPEPEPEPYKEEREPIGSPKKIPVRKSRKPEVPIPEGWVPNDRNIADAEQRGFSAQEIGHEADRFSNHHAAKGSLFRDWDAAWRTWLGNARTFAGRGVAGKASSSGYGQGGSIASIAARRRASGQV